MRNHKLPSVLFLGLLFVSISAGSSFADLAELRAEQGDQFEANIEVGYRGVSKENTTARVLEYDNLQSSPTFDVDLSASQGPYFFNFELDYLNEKDYSTEARLNTKGIAHFNLRTERFFHNLDHIPYDNGYTGSEDYPPPPGVTPRSLTGDPADGSREDGVYTDTTTNNDVIRTYYTDHDREDSYGLRLDINEAKFKIKHPSYPAHINFSYWRYEKKGEKQMRFVDENCATVCHMQSKTRDMDRVTEEFKTGVDAHAGMIDFAVEALFRTFRDKETIPADTFGAHFRGRDTSANPLEHSEDPDSKLTEFTVKANTAPSGGLVGSTSFTIGERENQSNLSSIAPVRASTDYYKSATDITYTPNQNWTINLRHRLLDMDSDNASQLASYDNGNLNDLEVREAMDIERSSYEMIVNYRPSHRLTVKGELRREDIKRSNTGPGNEHHSPGNPADPVEINDEWQLPERETITKAKLGFHSRLLEKSALKISGWISQQNNDDPAYGTSFEESRQLFLSGSYNPTPHWGMLANINLLKQENNEHELHELSLDREKKQQNFNLSSYVTPMNGLAFDLNYGFFRTDIDQGILFGAGSRFVPALGYPVDYAIPDDSADFEQKVHTISAGVTWQALDNLSCRLEAQHAYSRASFTPNFSSGVSPYNIYGTLNYATADSSSLKEISELDIRQNSLRGRVNWKIDEDWSCAVEATYDDYDDQNNDYYDGSVETAMISFYRVW